MALLVPLLVLGALEILLRTAGVGYSTGFFVTERRDGQEVLTENWQFGWRFFPPEIARTPQPVKFNKQKAPGTIRVFVFGESAAMGDPEPSFGLPRMLQAMLEFKFPSNKFEVINVAMTAINSHVIREIATDCASLGGDVWLIYMGNNEVVGPFGGGTVFSRQVPSLSFVRSSLWLKRFRLVQLLTGLRRHESTEWEGMEMFLKQQVPRHDPRMLKVYEHFRQNLEDIVATGQGAGAKVFVGTVAVNLRDSPPFGSMHRVLSAKDSKDFAEALALGVSLAGSNHVATAHDTFSRLQRSTPPAGADEYAELHYHLARSELALGAYEAAYTNFNLAKEYDTLRFRADDQIERTTRDVVSARAQAGVRLVDTAASLRGASSNSIPGAELFYEHVHLTLEGTYVLARAFYEDVIRSLPLANKREAAQPPTLEECARRLAWTDWNQLEIFEDMRKRLQQPPFTAQFGHAERDREWKRRIDELTVTVNPAMFGRIADEYRNAIGVAPDDWVLRENFAEVLEANGDTDLALAQWKEVMRLLPHDPQAYYHMGNLLDSVGRSEAALPFFRHALRRNPNLKRSPQRIGIGPR